MKNKNINSQIFLLILPFLVLLSSCLNIPEDCRNRIFSDVYSPNNKLKAVLFQRDCGATTSFSSQVAILPADKKLPNQVGNIFTADSNHGLAISGFGGGPKIEIFWVSDSELLIKRESRAKVFYSIPLFENVKIRYEILD